MGEDHEASHAEELPATDSVSSLHDVSPEKLLMLLLSVINPCTQTHGLKTNTKRNKEAWNKWLERIQRCEHKNRKSDAKEPITSFPTKTRFQG